MIQGGPSDRELLHAGATVSPLLERRLWAALADVAIVCACALALDLPAAFPAAPAAAAAAAARPAWYWVAACVLGAMLVLEVLTGLTPGKLAFGLRLHRPDGSRPPVWALAVRGVVKYVPVAIYAWSLALANAAMALWATAITVAFSYVAACYVMAWRTGATLFDAVAGTTLVRRGGGGGA